MDSEEHEREAIRRLVRELGASGGSRMATPEEISRLRDFFGRRVLRSYIDAYIQRKYDRHVELDNHWPRDTTPDEYLERLRETVLDPRSSIHLVDDARGEWSIYFVGRVRRVWRGRQGSDRILVIFGAERHRLVTGFQPEDGDEYIEQRGGFWLTS